MKRRLFIEPTIRFGDSKKRYPDLLICNARRIIGVVEFKYVPRGTPSVTKDLDTLLQLNSTENSVTIANERFLGVRVSKHYTVAEDAVLCWAGVYTGELLTLPSKAKRIGQRFMRLDALTREGAPAKIP